jgi:hypothetical protein
MPEVMISAWTLVAPVGMEQLLVVAPPFASVQRGEDVPLIVPEVSSFVSVPCTPVPVLAPFIVGVVIVGDESVGVVIVGDVARTTAPLPVTPLDRSAAASVLSTYCVPLLRGTCPAVFVEVFRVLREMSNVLFVNAWVATRRANVSDATAGITCC